MLGVIRFLRKSETEFEPEGSEGSEGSEGFIALPTSFSPFVVILFELLSGVSSNILIEL